MPVSSKCEEILKKGEHALIGISPFNSYFSEDTIVKLISWGDTNFKDFHLFVPDNLPYFNFLAMDYSHNKALTKTKKQNRYLFNKINRAFLRSGLDANNKMIIVSQFSENDMYKDVYNFGIEKYTNDVDFKRKCHNVSKLVLKSYTTADIDPSMLDIASKYLFGELPFLFDTPRILGVDSSLFVYHETVDFFVDLYNNREIGFVADNQGHLILKLNLDRVEDANK